MSTLDRRQFTLLPLLAAPLFLHRARATAAPAQFPPPPRPASLSLAARITPEGTRAQLLERLQRLRAKGFDGVEVVWPGSYRSDLVAAAAREAQCPIHSLRLGGEFGGALSSDETAVRQKGIERFGKALRLAAEFGASSLSVVAGAITPAVSDARAWNQVKIALREFLPEAEQLGVHIALRLGAGDFLASPLEAARFLDELGSPWLGWQLDTAWSSVRSYPQHWAHILGERIVKIDLADFSRAAASEHGLARGFAVQLGEGDVVGPLTLEALAHAVYSGWVTIDADESSLERLAADAQRARAWLEIA